MSFLTSEETLLAVLEYFEVASKSEERETGCFLLMDFLMLRSPLNDLERLGVHGVLLLRCISELGVLLPESPPRSCGGHSWLTSEPVKKE